MTGGCQHSPFERPQTPTGEQCTTDGRSTSLPLTPKSFNPFGHGDFDHSLSCIAKAPDASLLLNARVRFQPGSVTATGSTLADVGHVFTGGDLSPCCHRDELEAAGFLSGEVRTHGAFAVGTVANARIGNSSSSPLIMICKVTYDNDCNLVEEARQETGTVFADLTTSRTVRSLPSHSVATGFVRVDITVFTETEAVELPPMIDPINVDEVHAGGVTVRLKGKSIGPRVIQNFRRISDALIAVGGSAQASVSGSGQELPLAAADIAFDVQNLRSFDVTESSLAELTK